MVVLSSAAAMLLIGLIACRFQPAGSVSFPGKMVCHQMSELEECL
jgi:hypothetical protein